jgi:hypothetical protein
LTYVQAITRTAPMYQEGGGGRLRLLH